MQSFFSGILDMASMNSATVLIVLSRIYRHLAYRDRWDQIFILDLALIVSLMMAAKVTQRNPNRPFFCLHAFRDGGVALLMLPSITQRFLPPNSCIPDKIKDGDYAPFLLLPLLAPQCESLCLSHPSISLRVSG
jgi:hypothetical protein